MERIVSAVGGRGVVLWGLVAAVALFAARGVGAEECPADIGGDSSKVFNTGDHYYEQTIQSGDYLNFWYTADTSFKVYLVSATGNANLYVSAGTDKANETWSDKSSESSSMLDEVSFGIPAEPTCYSITVLGVSASALIKLNVTETVTPTQPPTAAPTAAPPPVTADPRTLLVDNVRERLTRVVLMSFLPVLILFIISGSTFGYFQWKNMKNRKRTGHVQAAPAVAIVSTETDVQTQAGATGTSVISSPHPDAGATTTGTRVV